MLIQKKKFIPKNSVLDANFPQILLLRSSEVIQGQYLSNNKLNYYNFRFSKKSVNTRFLIRNQFSVIKIIFAQ